MGKIFEALEKFTKESGISRTDKIKQSDYQALMNFDETTGKIKIDSPGGTGDQKSLQRLMTYRLIRSNGTLTPAGRAKYAEIKSRHPDRKPNESKMPRPGRQQAPSGAPTLESPGLTASDWAVLMKYDRKTGNLLKHDPDTGHLNHSAAEVLKSPDTIQRLIDANMILPGGWLTPEAKRACLRLEKKIHQKQAAASAEPKITAPAAEPDESTAPSDAINDADMDALLDYDPQTLKLNMSNPIVIKNPEIVKRFLDSGLIDAAGKLSPKALVRCQVFKHWKSASDENQALAAAKKDSIPKKSRKPTDKEKSADVTEEPDQLKFRVISQNKEAKKEGAKKAPDKVEKTRKTDKAGVQAQATNVSPPVTKAQPQRTPLASAQKAPEARPAEAIPEVSFEAHQDEIPKTRPEELRQTPSEISFALGKTPADQAKGEVDRNLVALLDSQSFEAEQFKILRTNLLFPESGRSPRSVMVTSAAPEEGKSFVAANLAVSVARHVNWNVLLMDCDLRRPTLHRQFGFDNVPGLSDYLTNGMTLQSLLLKTGIDRLTILPAGKSPDNPSEVLSSDRMSALLNEVTERYHDRLIIIDSPPPRLAAESNALARLVDGIVVVVKYAATSRDNISDLMDRLGRDKVLGAVINRFEARSPLYRSKYYGK